MSLTLTPQKGHVVERAARLAIVVLIATAGLAQVAVAQSYKPSFRPDELADGPAGQPNEVLVLASPHLSALPGSFRPEMVEPLVERLVRWRPTAVASEDMSGLRCDSLRRRPELNASTIRSYCFDPIAAGQAAGLDVPAASEEADRLLADWPDDPSSAQRRRLALVFLAAGEPASALVQWLRLPISERRAGDGMTEELAAHLESRRTRTNETDLVAAQVAARAGLERVWGVEDQPGGSGQSVDREAYGAALTSAWDNPATKARFEADARLHAALGTPDGLLNIYRAYNEPSYPELAYRSDWGAALAEPSPQGFGRRYVSYWETRNLRMVANIREVLGREPGTRLLAIVGASHKGYYEAHLNQIRDVTLTDVMPVLR